MIRRKVSWLLGAVLLGSFSSYGQPKGLPWLSLETNTTPLVFGGYAIAVNVTPFRSSQWGLLLGTAGNVDFPEWVTDVFKPQNSDRDIDWEVHRAYVFAIDYYLKGNGTEGWYVGWFNFFFDNQLRKAGLEEHFYSHTTLARGGYRWYPGTQSRFYLSPWVGIGTEYRINGQNRISDTVWKTSSVAYFASLNVGFTF